MSAEVGLAIFATIDLCYKYGERLVKLYYSLKAADSELEEILLRFDLTWYRTESQLNLLRSAWHLLDQTYRDIQNDVVQALAMKLQLALSKIENVVERTIDTRGQPTVRVNKWKFALRKEGLEKAVRDLERWARNSFDPSWFLIMKGSQPQIDAELAVVHTGSNDSAIRSARSLRIALYPGTDDKTAVFLPPEGLRLAQCLDIPLSSLKFVQRVGSNQWLILDTIARPLGVGPQTSVKDVRDIARRLTHADPLTFGLLNCYGVVKNCEADTTVPRSFTFVFRVPRTLSQPRSLRQLFCTESDQHSLSERFEIAKGMARSVFYVHSFGFVHKNIRPETIVMLHDRKSALGIPFLVGFEAFRVADGRTMWLGDSQWDLNLYRHPNRQGERPTDEYIMQHDIYSLGVCLLELGLYKSFIKYENDMPISPSTVINLDIEGSLAVTPCAMQAKFISLAQTVLPKQMGTKYADIVLTCLTCLEEGNLDFGDASEFEDDDGVLVSVRYMEKVLERLNQLFV